MAVTGRKAADLAMVGAGLAACAIGFIVLLNGLRKGFPLFLVFGELPGLIQGFLALFGLSCVAGVAICLSIANRLLHKKR